MLEFITKGYKGSAVKYSPFFDNRICVTASANYGLVGNARLYSLMLTPQGIQVQTTFDTQDAIFDLAWSESNENQVAVSCGDGSIKIFDTSVDVYPIANFAEHMREVYAVHWNLVTKDTFVSGSWDGTLKVWNPNRASSLLTIPTHSCTYSTAFSPHSPSIVSSVSSDSHLRIFDLRTPASASNHLVTLIPVHGPAPIAGARSIVSNAGPASQPSEVLTHDWNKYRDGIIATGSVDARIRTFDIRNPSSPLAVLAGHEYAIRKLVWSPHLSDTLLTASYDMSCRIWSDGTMNASPARQLGRMDRHTEFVGAVDWCLFGEGWCASTAWDERLLVWDSRTAMGP